jgi:hypothetical protein
VSYRLRNRAKGGKDHLTRRELFLQGSLIGVPTARESSIMDGIIYLVGLIVIIMAILSFFGLR